MIASLRGTIEALSTDYAVINVGGVGLQVFVPASTLSTLGIVGQQARLFTQMIVREDEIRLFGFAAEEDLKLFQLLQGVSGFGPKLALTLLSAMTSEELATAIAGGSVELLTSVPGIGKKLAGRLVLELKDKISAGAAAVRVVPMGEADGDVIGALLSLGYSANEASRAVTSLPRDAKLTVEEKITLALGYFEKG